MKTLRRLWPVLGLGMAVLLGGCGGSGGSDDPEVRQTTYGAVQGQSHAASGTLSWKGVPFAQPPVGALRWKAPQEPMPWSGTRTAQRFGNACLQNGRIYGPGANNTYDGTIATTLNTPVGSEDCLTLNIWRPSTEADGAKLPVIVFIYGGSNISGYTADPVYDGAALAKAANAVVVTTNYRLGVLGFLNLPQLKTGSNAAEDSGNFALLDILQALKFVKANIGSFGGDAANVTLMGQSAGAINILALLASPSATGLFHKMVPISGGISLASNLPAGMIPTLNPASAYLAQGNGLLAHLLVADGKAVDLAAAQAYIAGQTPQAIADYLRAKDAKTVLSTVLAKGLNSSGPIPDGTLVPLDPIATMAAGRHNKVPMLVGTTADEGKLFAPLFTLLGGKPGHKIGDAQRFDMMAAFNPDAPTALTVDDIIDPSYLPVAAPGTGYNAKAALLGNVFITPSRDNLLNTLRTQQSNVWYYQFHWARQPAPWADVYGAAHAFDLPFLFGNFGPSVFANATNSTANRPGRLALSGAMMASLAAFARTGDPNSAALGVTWQPWPKQLRMDATLTQAAISAP